jgi:LEA14-like dessication related protein
MIKKAINLNKLFLILLSSLILTSCGDFEDIQIGEPQEFVVQGFEDNLLKISVALPVENPTLNRIKIQEIDAQVFLNNQYIGKLIVDEQVVIKPKSSNLYQLPVKVRIANILNTAFIMMSMRKGQQIEIRIEGVVKVRTLLLTKTIEINESNNITM